MSNPSKSESGQGGLFLRLGRFTHERPKWILIALFASLFPAGWLASQLEVRPSFLDLLPEHEVPVRQLNTVLRHARSASDIAIAISTKDRALAERFAVAFETEIAKQPGVAGVGGHLDPGWFRERRLMFADERQLEEVIQRVEESIDHELLKRTGVYVDLEEPTDGEAGAADPKSMLAELDRSDASIPGNEWVLTTDSRYLCVWAYFAGNTGDLAFGRAALSRVEGVVDRLRDGKRFPRDLEVRYSGGIPTRVADERALVSDLRIAGSVGFIAVILLIVASLRAPRALVILAVPLFVGLVWTFAFARVAIGHLNIISGFLFSILSGLGVEYGIHLVHRYRELRDEGLALEPAIERLVSSTGRALLSGSLTNASVFAVIAAAQFRGFSEFGIIAAVGLLLTLLSTLVGLPALIVLGERIKPLPSRPARSEREREIHVPRPLRLFILAGVPLFALTSLAALAFGHVRFDGNWRVLTGNSETTKFAEYLRHHLGGLYTGAILWVPNDEDLPRVVHAVDRVRQSAGRRRPSQVVELATRDRVVPTPSAQARRIELAAALGRQLDRIRPETLDEQGRAQLVEAKRLVAAARVITPRDLPYAAVGHFATQDGRGSIVHLQMKETDDPGTGALVRWAAEARGIRDSLDRDRIESPMLSENWIAGEIFERIQRDGKFLLFGTLIAVFLVLLVDFRRPLIALGVLGSVILGVLSIAGGMALTHLSLNFMNAAILPVCVGISLDNAIHVYHRWKEGGAGSIPRVLGQTMAANALASSTNLIGFAALALTSHEGLRSVAYLAMIGVTATYVSTTLWFPMVFETIDARRASGAKTPT